MPNIHPFLVHFPIGLLTLSFILDVISHISRKPAFAQSAWLNQGVGTLTLIATVVSGVIAGNSGVISPGAQTHFDTHQELAFVSTTLFLGLLLWRAGSKGVIPKRGTTLYLALTAASVCFLLATAWFGGDLVYVFGTGVRFE